MVAARSVAVLLLATVVLAGCSARHRAADKAGGERRAEPVVLTLATTSNSIADAPPVLDFITMVSRLSHGSVRVTVQNQWGNLDPHGEPRLVHAVAAGRIDLAFVGSRTFDLVGVEAFSALTAPTLIDSYPLEEAVMRSSLPAQMLPALRPLGVVGIGVFGDALRHPIGVRRPLDRPAAFRNLRFGTYPSRTGDIAIHALGARPFYAFGAYREHELDLGRLGGFEYDVDRYAWYGLPTLARYVTGNIVLWPQVDVVIANPRHLASLTPQQRSWLFAAARIAAGRSVAAYARRTARDVRTACALGARFVEARPVDLAAIASALRPAYARLERDPGTTLFLAQIRKLKRTVGAAQSLASPPLRCRS